MMMSKRNQAFSAMEADWRSVGKIAFVLFS